MADGCPLSTGLYWENRGDIPEYCETNCGQLMEEAIKGVPHREYDLFVEAVGESGCVHDEHTLETEDISLQRGNGPERIVGVTDDCMGCGTEYGAQSYVFVCPKD